MRVMDADKYCEFLNAYPLEKAQSNPMAFYRDALQHTFECEVEAEPIKRGHWKQVGVIHDRKDAKIQDWQQAKCSVCGKWQTTPYMYYLKLDNYCPNCGAKMYEEKEYETETKKPTPVTQVKNTKHVLSCFKTAELLEELVNRQEKEQLTPKWEKIDNEYDGARG